MNNDTHRLDWIIKKDAKINDYYENRIIYYSVIILGRIMSEWHSDYRDAIDEAMENEKF